MAMYLWWIVTLLLVCILILISLVANMKRYDHLRKAHQIYLRRGLEETFIDYVLMETTDLDTVPIGEIRVIKGREILWSRIASLSYSISTVICATVVISSFYGIFNVHSRIEAFSHLIIQQHVP